MFTPPAPVPTPRCPSPVLPDAHERIEGVFAPRALQSRPAALCREGRRRQGCGPEAAAEGRGEGATTNIPATSPARPLGGPPAGARRSRACYEYPCEVRERGESDRSHSEAPAIAVTLFLILLTFPRALQLELVARGTEGLLRRRCRVDRDVQGPGRVRHAARHRLRLAGQGPFCERRVSAAKDCLESGHLRRRRVRVARAERLDPDGRAQEARGGLLFVLRAEPAGLRRELLQARREVGGACGAAVRRGHREGRRRRVHRAGGLPGEVHDVRASRHRAHRRRFARPGDGRLHRAGLRQATRASRPARSRWASPRRSRARPRTAPAAAATTSARRATPPTPAAWARRRARFARPRRSARRARARSPAVPTPARAAATATRACAAPRRTSAETRAARARSATARSSARTTRASTARARRPARTDAAPRPVPARQHGERLRGGRRGLHRLRRRAHVLVSGLSARPAVAPGRLHLVRGGARQETKERRSPGTSSRGCLFVRRGVHERGGEHPFWDRPASSPIRTIPLPGRDTREGRQGQRAARQHVD